MWLCYLCSSERTLLSYLCSDCMEISRIVKVVNKDIVLSILKKECLKSQIHPIKEVSFVVDKKKILTKTKSYSDVLHELQSDKNFKNKKKDML